MIHLAFPSMAENHHWIEEGISVYVEPVARVQAGQLVGRENVARCCPRHAARRAESRVTKDSIALRRGDALTGEERCSAWSQMFVSESRPTTSGDCRTPLRGILAAGGNITQDWDVVRAFAMGDKATGTTVPNRLDIARCGTSLIPVILPPSGSN